MKQPRNRRARNGAPPSSDARSREKARVERSDLPLWKKLVFSIVTVVIVLALLEAGARLFTQLTPNSRWESHKQLVDAVGFPALNEILVPDPTLFWTLAPNVDRATIAGRIGRSSEIQFVVSTDANGARRVPPVPGSRRHVAFLGDSTTFGLGVDDNQVFAALVQQKLAGVQAINLGVPGYTAYQGRLRLETFPFAQPPAAVVIDFGFNDAAAWDNLSDIDQERRLWAQRWWLTRESRLVTLMAGLFRKPAAEPSASPSDRRPRLTDEEFASEIRAIVSWCRARHTEPVLLVWPVRGQLQRDDLLPKQRVLLEMAASDHVRVVNLLPAFRFGGPADFLDVVHASPAGHAVVADMLAPVLRSAIDGR